MSHDETYQTDKFDELLALLNAKSDSDEVHALRAVVELHKPVAFVKGKGLFCDNCLPDRYPCTTIQAIEKQLSDSPWGYDLGGEA